MMSTDQTTEKKFYLFGGECSLVIYGSDFIWESIAFDDFYKEALRLQKIFNFYDNESELSQLNKKREMKVSDELFEVILKAKKYSELSNGKYDISTGKIILQRKNGEEISKSNCSYKDIILDEKNKKITLTNSDVLIDLGSIAKGYITDKLSEYLFDLGLEDFLIDSRGDMRVNGEHEEKLEIQHPRNKDKGIFPFVLKNSSVATSGDYNQYIDSYEQNHIVGDTDFISVTVISKTASDADVLASVIYLEGTHNFKKIINTITDTIKDIKDIQVVAFDKDLKNYQYNWAKA